MPNYRRAFVPGGTWFFTVNLLQRRGLDLLVRDIDLLRNTVRRVRDWPYSTFHQYVEAGVYPVGWCGDVDVDVRNDERHASDYATLIGPTRARLICTKSRRTVISKKGGFL
jgi:hypothetical protein